MEIKGEEQITAPRVLVWQILNDTEVLRLCIDGCEKLERVSENHINAVLKVRLGIINLRFHGSLLLSDMKPPFSYNIAGVGRGALSGLATGKTHVVLEEIEWPELDANKRKASLLKEAKKGKVKKVIAVEKISEQRHSSRHDETAGEFGKTRKATRLVYHMLGTADGKLAQLGSKVLGKLARKVADRFFHKLAAACEKAAAENA